MALSMAAELNVAPDTEFQFYGKTYLYKTPAGATSLLSGRMNARVYRTRVMTIDGWNASRVATTFDVEVRLRMPVIEGFNLCGDFYWYVGGGHEVVEVNTASVHRIHNYLEPDQTKWGAIIWPKQQSAEFSFEDTYEMIGEGAVIDKRYVMLRQPFGSWPYGTGTNISMGECGYHNETALASKNNRCRAGVCFRGYALIDYCSARNVYSAFSVVYCSAVYAGSAQVLLDLGDAVAAQPQ